MVLGNNIRAIAEQTEVEILHQNISEYAKHLDDIRGKFQVAMIEKSSEFYRTVTVNRER